MTASQWLLMGVVLFILFERTSGVILAKQEEVELGLHDVFNPQPYWPLPQYCGDAVNPWFFKKLN